MIEPQPALPHRRGSSRLARLVVALAVAVLALPLLGSPASAQAVSLSQTTVAPGGSINLSGDSCFTNATPPLQFTVQGPGAIPNAGITGFNWSGVTGLWSATLSVPANAVPGTYSLTVRCVRQFVYPPRTFTVSASGTSTSTSTSTSTPGTTSTTVAPAGGSSFCDDLVRARRMVLDRLGANAAADLIATIDRLRTRLDCAP